jgi:predicted kinase
MDYTYHSNYTRERQRFQDSIICEFMNAAVITDKNGEVCTTPTEPWLVFTAGAMGAGKSYTLNKLVNEGRFPLLAFVQVDPDAIRMFIPEYHVYVAENPELAGKLTQKEAGYIAEILTMAGLGSGKNVIVDGSLRDFNWYSEYFAFLRKKFSNLRIAIIHVTAPAEAVFARAEVRC